MELFKSGHSKAEIGRAIGKTRDQVKKIIAQAIKGAGRG